MTKVFKICFFIILSITFPIGRMFEMFIWNNTIIRNEYVVQAEKSDISNTAYSLFNVITQETEHAGLSFRQQDFILFSKMICNGRSKHILSDQNCLFNSLKGKLIRRYLFISIYSDEFEYTTA